MPKRILTQHGMSRTKTYRTWANMLSRCRNRNTPNWKYYGGRGIRVCKRWYSFVNFLTDMGERPAKLTIERIQNHLGYRPGNCRRATMREQRVNQRKPSPRTRCLKGHPLTPLNTYTSPRGWRVCRTCERRAKLSLRRRKGWIPKRSHWWGKFPKRLI